MRKKHQHVYFAWLKLYYVCFYYLWNFAEVPSIGSLHAEIAIITSHIATKDKVICAQFPTAKEGSHLLLHFNSDLQVPQISHAMRTCGDRAGDFVGEPNVFGLFGDVL